MLDKVFKESKDKMESALNASMQELKTIRTGRASLSLLDGVTVNYYGSQTPLNQVASLAIPDPGLITVQPWDVSVIGDIEKAIMKSDLGLNPSNDGKIIRIPIPPLTEERRKQLAKLVGKIAENGKTSIRNVRRTGNETVKEMKKNAEISEDDQHRAFKEIQDLTDEYIKKLEDISQQKQKEITEL
jgi:ribosome recycling factor